MHTMVMKGSEELNGSIERYFRKNHNKLLILFPEPYTEDIDEFINKIKKDNNTIILFLSIFPENDSCFMDAYEKWLFIIKHYASKVIEVPFEIQELNTIEEKKYMEIQKVEEFYEEVKKSMKNEQ